MDITEIIKTIVYVISILISTTLVIIAYKRKDKAKTTEEQNALDEIIQDQMKLAIDNIKSVCNANNLMFNAKQTNKIAKKIIKDNKNNGTNP